MSLKAFVREVTGLFKLGFEVCTCHCYFFLVWNNVDLNASQIVIVEDEILRSTNQFFA